MQLRAWRGWQDQGRQYRRTCLCTRLPHPFRLRYAQSWRGPGREQHELSDRGDRRRGPPAAADPRARAAGRARPAPAGAKTARKLITAGRGDAATARSQGAFTVGLGLIRSLQVGQACCIRRKSAVCARVARPEPAPLSLPAACRLGGPPRSRDAAG